MARDIANIFNDAYSKTAPKVLGAQHRYLLDRLESHMRERPGNLLVLGCGAQVLPYSVRYENGMLGGTNRERIKKIVNEGELTLADYVQDGLDKARDNLKRLGFTEEGYVGKNTSLLLQDLNDPLALPDESQSAIDANLSTHHVTRTVADMKRLYKELHRVLLPGGRLFLGEGNVDMGYTEEKIDKIRKDLSDAYAQPVSIVDQRDHETKHGTGLEVILDDQGIVHAKTKDSERLSAQMHEKGYVQMIVRAGEVMLPLIDPEMEEDRQHIQNVDDYYGQIWNLVVNGYPEDKTLQSQIATAIDDEANNARNGIVEYYRDPKLIEKVLTETGFDVQIVKYHDGPFYNIVAQKVAPE